MKTRNFPYEIHISVKNDSKNFDTICNDLNVKPIKLNLFNSKSEIVDNHLMTSSVMKGSHVDLQNNIDYIKNTLIDNGLTILRTKVESVPWHPQTDNLSYYEHHIDVQDISLEELTDIVNDLNDFFSKNMIAISSNIKKNNISLTIRSYHIDYFKFFINMKKIKNFLKQYMQIEEDDTIEYAIYDDNLEMDKLWL